MVGAVLRRLGLRRRAPYTGPLARLFSNSEFDALLRGVGLEKVRSATAPCAAAARQRQCTAAAVSRRQVHRPGSKSGLMSLQREALADVPTWRRLGPHPDAATQQASLARPSTDVAPRLRTTSPFVRTAADVQRLYATVEEYLEKLGALATVRFATISEAARALAMAT